MKLTKKQMLCIEKIQVWVDMMAAAHTMKLDGAQVQDAYYDDSTFQALRRISADCEEIIEQSQLLINKI